jgi:hypothetical protein
VQPPAPAQPKKSRTPLIIGVAVVAVAAVAVGGYFLLKKDDNGPSALSTRQAARNVADLADASKVTSELYRSDLTACPMGDFKSLVAAGSPDLQGVGDVVTGEGDELRTEVYKMNGDTELTILQCYSNDSGTNAELGVYAAEMNGTAGYRDTLAKLFPTWTFKFEADAAFRGGTFVKYCVSAKDATNTDSPFCETDWITDDLQIGAFVYGDARSTALTTDWLTAILPDVVGNLSSDAFGRITAGEPY